MAIQKSAFRDHKNPRDVRGSKCPVLSLTQRKGGEANVDTHAIALHWWEVRPQGFKVSCIGSYTEEGRGN